MILSNLSILSKASKWFRPCLGLLALALLAQPVAHAGDRVPVKSSLTGHTVSRVDFGNPLDFGVPFAAMVDEAEGTASHSGRIRIVSHYLIRLEIESGGVVVVIGEGTYVTTTANGSVHHGTFLLRQVYGQSAYTLNAEDDSGAILQGVGESFPDGTFAYKMRGTTPNPGKGH